jgi:hypothetical protein
MARTIFPLDTIIWTLIFVAAFSGIFALEQMNKLPFGSFAPHINRSVTYTILRHENSGNVEKYAILIRSSEDGEAAAQILQRSCKKTCDIDVYDDRNALSHQMRFDAMTKNSSSDTPEASMWISKNFSFLAQHYVGWFDGKTGEYFAYPVKNIEAFDLHSSFYR